MIAHEYGYTLNQFLNLTDRILVILLAKIDVRIHKRVYNQIRLEAAAFYGKNMPEFDEAMGISKHSTSSAFDKKTDAVLEKRARELLEAKQRTYGR